MNLASTGKKLPTEADCISHLERVRWNGKPVCPYCNSTRTSPIPREARHHCNACNTTFSVNDRPLMEITCLLKPELEARKIDARGRTELINCLKQLGIVPSDRQPIKPEGVAAPDEWDEIDP